jgi:hypothetical protein
MNNIVEELGVKDIDNYPEESFDLIWTVAPPYKEIASVTSELCPGLDI